MKTFLVLMALLINVFQLSAQSGNKPAKEITPTNKEMQDMMKEAQKMMGEMSAEDKKMMDSLGFKMPDMNQMKKNAGGISDAQLKAAYDEEMRVIPQRDATKIAAIPLKVFSTTELLAYAKKTNASIEAIIKPESKQMAEVICDMFKKDKYYGALIASAANGLWMDGNKEAGVYLMGRAIEALPNANNYNNYAAYLTMMGAAHIAIPVLNKLNAVHKNNSTILNNLAQAWLQLGDTEKTNKYLDSAIRIYAYHPQANYTKCLILESKGKKTEAIDALNRSLKHSVTTTKLNKLKQLEGSSYIPRFHPVPKVYASTTFNLGLYTAMIPTVYAKEPGNEEELVWEEFRRQIRQEKERLENKRNALALSIEDEGKKLESLAVNQRGQIFPPYYYQAVERYKNYTQGSFLKLKKEAQDGAAYLQTWANLKNAFSTELKEEQDRFAKSILGTGNTSANCEGLVPIIKKYLLQINNLNQKYNVEKVNRLEKDYYQMNQYLLDIAITDGAALKSMLDLKFDFLQKLLELKHESISSVDCARESKEQEPNTTKELPDYDEVNCNILNSINFPGFGSVVMRCNNMSMDINSKLLPFRVSYTRNFEGFTEQASIGIKLKAADIEAGAKFDGNGNFVKGTGSVSTTIKGIEVSASGEVSKNGFEKGSIELGIDGELGLIPESLEEEAPVDISLKDKLGVSMDIDNKGTADFGVKNNVTVDFASSIEIDKSLPEAPFAPSVSVSADNSWSVNSGYSPGKGSLSGLKN